MIQLRLSQRIHWTNRQHRQWSLLVMRTPMIQLPLLTLQPMIQQRLLQQLLHVTARVMKLLLSEKQRRIQQAAWKSHQQRKQRWMAKSDRCTIFFIEMFWTHEQDSVFTHASKLGIFFTNNVRYVPREAVATYYSVLFSTACRWEKWQSYWTNGDWKLLFYFSWHLVTFSGLHDLVMTWTHHLLPTVVWLCQISLLYAASVRIFSQKYQFHE